MLIRRSSIVFYKHGKITTQQTKTTNPCFLYTTVHVKLLILMSLGKQTVWITVQSRTLSNTVDGYINCSSKDIRIVRLSPLLLYHNFLNLSGFVYFSMTQQECLYNSYCVSWRDCAFRRFYNKVFSLLFHRHKIADLAQKYTKMCNYFSCKLFITLFLFLSFFLVIKMKQSKNLWHDTYLRKSQYTF